MRRLGQSALTDHDETVASDDAQRVYAEFQDDPVGYIDQLLGQKLWGKQEEVARAVIAHRKVMVKASHSVGKSHLAGGLTNWHFDCFAPSITLTTASSKQQVEDVLWKEVRIQRGNRPGLQPKAPRMQYAPDHFAAGYTARDSNAFQGRHEAHVGIIFDEATGIEGQFWDGAEGMMTGERCWWLAILNPTDLASRAYAEDQSGSWHVITISALDHPNIAADLAGMPAPFPKAVRLVWLEEKIERWCQQLAPSDKRASDFEFPPGSGKWYRPGPLFEGRVMGRWPSAGSTSVWAEASWMASLERKDEPRAPLEIGCDVARFGDDYTSIVVRRGACALHHETHNGWNTAETAGALKGLAKEFAQEGEDPKSVAVRIDDDGVGGGVVDQAGGFRFIAVHGAGKPIEPDEYPNKRSELWFSVSERAYEGRLDLSRLSDNSKRLLRSQVMAPTWKLDSQGRRVVEPKERTKKRIGRSPDDADALNLCFDATYLVRPASAGERFGASVNQQHVQLTNVLRRGVAGVIPGINPRDRMRF